MMETTHRSTCHSRKQVRRRHRSLLSVATQLLRCCHVLCVCAVIKQSSNTMEAQGEGMYSSYSFTTSALDGIELSASLPGRVLPLMKGPPVPILQEAGWAPEPVWTQRLEEKCSFLCRGSNLDRPVVQPVARHCTD
jgi:hypothetical protein